jgi:hypothetical protein
MTRSTFKRARAVSAGTRAQTAPIAVVLILAIVLFGSIAVVATGQAAVADARYNAELDRAEHALGQFDARMAQVALGDSPAQSIPLGPSGSGQYDVVEDAGRLTVVHHNYTAGADETIYDGPLGALVYRNGDATVAAQGGGVWRHDGTNGSIMISPPEVHYRSETLILPVIELGGTDSASGDRRAVVTSTAPTKRIYPSEVSTGTGVGAPYDDGSLYQNPVKGGRVSVTVRSDYYQAWGRYFDSRTQGAVSYDHAAKTATVELSAPLIRGAFDMPDEGNHVPVRGLVEGHQLEKFEITLAPDNADAANFFNLQWSMYASEGSRELELHLRLDGSNDDTSTLCKEQDISATVYYSDANGDPYHGWHNSRAFRTSCTDRDGDGVEDEVELAANLTSAVPLAMSDLSSSDVLWANPNGATRETTVTFHEHNATVGWEPKTFSGTNDASVDDLLNHYFGLLGPDFDFVVDDKNSDTVNEGASGGVLEYGARGRVTYIHISENEVGVSLS